MDQPALNGRLTSQLLARHSCADHLSGALQAREQHRVVFVVTARGILISKGVESSRNLLCMATRNLHVAPAYGRLVNR